MERTIKHKVYTYHVKSQGMKPNGEFGEILVERQARRGEKVDIPIEAEVHRGDELDAFYTDAELEALASQGTAPGGEVLPPEALVAEGGPDLVTMDEDTARAWLEGSLDGSSKPSVPQVLNAINSVPEAERKAVAQRVLDAEEARDGDPRSTLVEPLTEYLADEE